MDIKDIKDLITSINNTDIETVEIQKNDFRLMITKGKSNEKSGGDSRVRLEKPIVYDEVVEIKEDLVDNNLYIVRSPMVGTFYGASSPDGAPFVKVGEKIEHGQTLCIIEAMKTMNEIECEVSGEIVEILVDDEDVVEYGQALMKVRR